MATRKGSGQKAKGKDLSSSPKPLKDLDQKVESLKGRKHPLDDDEDAGTHEGERAEALQREAEKAAREKQRKEAEVKERKEAEKKALEDKLKKSSLKSPTGKGGPAGMNITMDVPQSPQTYVITPKGANKTVKLTGNPDDYGMDQNSDDSTDDESAPRKPIPSWATGQALQQALLKEYFNPPDLHALFGAIAPPNLEEIFNTKKVPMAK